MIAWIIHDYFPPIPAPCLTPLCPFPMLHKKKNPHDKNTFMIIRIPMATKIKKMKVWKKERAWRPMT